MLSLSLSLLWRACSRASLPSKYVADGLRLQASGFLPPTAVWGQCAPAENDTDYAGKTIQGQVSDGNTYAMGVSPSRALA